MKQRDTQSNTSSTTPNLSRYRPLALMVSLAFSAMNPAVSQAATFFVTNTNDANAGSLRRAIFNANNNAGADTIEFTVPSGSTVNLASELTITDSVTIKGPTSGDASSINIMGDLSFRLINAGGFPANSGQTLTLENMTLRNGSYDGSASGLGGGAVFVKNADLVLNSTLVTFNSTVGNNAGGGGLSVNNGNATLTKTVLALNFTSGGRAGGAGLYVKYGDAILNQSTVSGNSTSGINAYGGGLSVAFGAATLNESTVSGNSTSGFNADGGGLRLRECGISRLTQSTVSGNSTTGVNADSGGLSSSYCGVIVEQSTIVNNVANAGAGGMSIYYYSSDLTNSILSANSGPEGNFHEKIAGTLNVTNSMFGDPVAEIDGVNTAAYIDNTPDLGPLQHNGGLTKTHKPKPISNAVDLGSNTAALAFSNDQRGLGFQRIHHGIVDMGAVELQLIPGIDPVLNIHEVITRRDMAREILKKIEGSAFKPPVAVGNTYDDVHIGDVNADWIEEFQRRGFSEGCAPNKFCPNMVVSKDQMAKVFTKAKGLAQPPPHTNQVFFDVASGSFAWEYITALRDNGWSTGCTSFDFFGATIDSYCPDNFVFREWFDNLLVDLP